MGDSSPLDAPSRRNGHQRSVRQLVSQRARRELLELGKNIGGTYQDWQDARRQRAIDETPESEVWRNPLAFAAYERKKKLEAMQRLDTVRRMLMDAITPILEKLQDEVSSGDFDPRQIQTFMALQLAMMTVPKSAKDVAKVMDSLAQVLGHAKGPKEGDEPITEDSIAQALVRMAERAREIQIQKTKAIEEKRDEPGN